MLPFYYLPAISALDLLSSAVALAVAYAAYKYNRLVSGSVPAFVGISFSLLGMGLLLQGSLAAALFLSPSVEGARLFIISSYLYLSLQVASYLILAVGYVGAAYSVEPALAAPILRRALEVSRDFFDFVQLLSAVLLALVVFSAIQLRARGSFSSLVLGAFILILLGHVFMLASAVGPLYFYALGSVVRFAGFALLLAFLVRGRHIA